ncbi:HAD-IC family P-type ATPase [Geosporobacter ferrireducens]|uniref:HAD-IC family P-type ATPase n=1 Tax=Geosporobacter ferrireducens TaxID=1424294 RepID=UPI0023526C4A|nr:HAD-IC family P-type ATPase [Geosporobacter ferrireducens]
MYYANASGNKFILPGRLRIYIKDLKDNPAYGERIKRLLSEIIGIHSITANHFTGKVLVYFDEKKIDVNTIETQILQAKVLDLHFIGNEEDMLQVITKTGIFKQPEFRRTLIAGTVLIGILIKQFVFGRTSLAENYDIFTAAAATTILTGYPLFKKGIGRYNEKGKVNYELMLSITAFACILLRESTLSLFVVTTAYLSEAIMTYIDKCSKKMFEDLFKNRSEKVHKLIEGESVEIDYDEIQLGDLLQLRSGDFLPVDGDVYAGEGILNQKALNGESLPHIVKIGDKVYAGTIVDQGNLLIKVEKVGQETEYRKILALVDGTWKDQDSFQNVVEQHYHRWMPYVAGMSFISFILTGDIMVLITLLLIACPKPAYHATPIAIRTAFIKAYTEGIFIRNPNAIEWSSKATRVVFDKTGTLTMGNPPAGIQDLLRMESGLSIEALRSQGIHNFEILSGDKREIVEKTASELGIDCYQWGVSPKNKAEIIQAAVDRGDITIMVGDGINDGPALSRAHVGIMLGEKPDLNILSGVDVILFNNNILSVPRFIDLSRCTIKNINQSHNLSLGMNIFGALLVLTNGISPFFASFYKDINSLIVLLNAMRLSRVPVKYLNRQVN